jgi:endonuclease/exonuclease/phosphatase (EEP) superfamily protein YafD
VTDESSIPDDAERDETERDETERDETERDAARDDAGPVTSTGEVRSFGPPRHVGGRRGALLRVWGVTLVAAASGFVAVEIARRVGTTEPRTLIALYALTPYLALLGLIGFVLAAVTRRWIAAAAFVPVVVLHAIAVVPVLGSDPQPAWADGAPTVSVFFANLHANGPVIDDKFQTALDAGADVMILVELTPEGADAIRRLDVGGRYRHVVDASAWGTGGFGIFSTVPVEIPLGDPKPTSTLIAAQIVVGATPVHLFGEHTTTPTFPEGIERWLHQFGRLRETLDRVDGPVVLVGDFNATHWHEPLEDVRRDYGFSDIHQWMGQGLSMSFPTEGRRLARFGPFMRVDHGLVNDGLAPRSVADVRIPGSDHLGFVTEIAVRQPGDG